MNTLLLVLGGIALSALIRKKRKKSISGIGAIKRRIWAEVSDAQNMGVDFEKKYSELDRYDLQYLQIIGERFGWKQSKRSIEAGKPYTESYYNSLRRAYRSITGIEGIGKARDYYDYRVYNKDGKTALIYREYKDAIDHVSHEESTVDEAPVVVEEEVVVDDGTKQLNEKRIALLDKAKHMQVCLEDGRLITGDERYNYLPYINYIVMARQTFGDEYSPDGKPDVTIYPMRSYANEEEAKDFAKERRYRSPKKGPANDPHSSYYTPQKKRLSLRAVPVMKVDIDSISGIPV